MGGFNIKNIINEIFIIVIILWIFLEEDMLCLFMILFNIYFKSSGINKGIVNLIILINIVLIICYLYGCINFM